MAQEACARFYIPSFNAKPARCSLGERAWGSEGWAWYMMSGRPVGFLIGSLRWQSSEEAAGRLTMPHHTPSSTCPKHPCCASEWLNTMQGALRAAWLIQAERLLQAHLFSGQLAPHPHRTLQLHQLHSWGQKQPQSCDHMSGSRTSAECLSRQWRWNRDMVNVRWDGHWTPPLDPTTKLRRNHEAT